MLATSDEVQSYPTEKSRALAFVAVAIIWTYFGARTLHESWATQGDARLLIVPIVVGLLTLSKNQNVNVRVRPATSSRERQFVHRLRLLKRISVLGTVVSVLWLLVTSSDDFMVSYIVPLCIFVISETLGVTSTVLYRPFVIWEANPDKV